MGMVEALSLLAVLIGVAGLWALETAILHRILGRLQERIEVLEQQESIRMSFPEEEFDELVNEVCEHCGETLEECTCED